MHRLCILTQYFPPEMGAPQRRLSELGEKLIDLGWEVEVLTALPNYPTGRIFDGYDPTRYCVEQVGRMRVIRVPLYAAQQGFAKRLRCYFSFAASAARYGPRLCSTPDLLLVESPPLFIGIAAVHLARRWHCPFVLNVSDLWPRSAIQLGLLKPGLMTWMAERLERWLYRRAAGITGQTSGLVESIRERCPNRPTRVITNGVDPELFGRHRADDEARALLGDEPGPIFVFAGLFGYAQRLDWVLDLARRLPAEVQGRFVLVGDGHAREHLAGRVADEGISRVKFLPAQSIDRLAALLAAADAAIIPVTLAIPEVVPTKFYEALGSSLPILLVARGEGVRRLEEAGAGIAVESEDPESLERAFRRLVTDPELRRRFGEAGRRAAETRYSRTAIAGELDSFLRDRLVERDAGGEVARLKSVYRDLATGGEPERWRPSNPGNREIVRERTRRLEQMLETAGFCPLAKCDVLDVGCGNAGELARFERMGVPPERLHGLELSPERVEQARRLHPAYHLVEGNAEHLDYEDASFDLVLLLTVLSSILDKGAARRVAQEVTRVLRPSGAVVWYDLRHPRPDDARLRGISAAAIRELFPGLEPRLESVTLLPPIARRLGKTTSRLYPLLAQVPLLRSHYLGLLTKPPESRSERAMGSSGPRRRREVADLVAT